MLTRFNGNQSKAYHKEEPSKGEECLEYEAISAQEVNAKISWY